jgi:hypothetical protein
MTGPRRLVLIAGLVTVAVAVAATFAVVWPAASAPAAQRLAYSHLPGPCRLFTASTLAAYVPDAITSPLPGQARGLAQTSGCGWISITGHHQRELLAVVSLYDGPAAVTHARAAFAKATSAAGGTSAGVTTTTHPVSGVGDQAVAISYNAGKTPDPRLPQTITLDVRSSNAIATVLYTDDPLTATDAPSTEQDLAGLADQVTLARDVLAVLAHPATAAAATTTVPSGPHYRVPPHACRLVSAAALRTYLPDATVSPSSRDTPDKGYADCLWGTSTLSGLTVAVDIYGSAGGMLGAQVAYETEVQQQDLSYANTTVTRTRPVADLGQQATVIYSTSDLSTAGATLLIWSGNAVVQIDLSYDDTLGTPIPSRATQGTAVSAVARDVLAALAAGG